MNTETNQTLKRWDQTIPKKLGVYWKKNKSFTKKNKKEFDFLSMKTDAILQKILGQMLNRENREKF